MAPADLTGIRVGKELCPPPKKRLTSERYFSLSGTTSMNALASFDLIARGVSAGAIFLKVTLSPRSYSFFRASTIFWLISPPTTPTVWPFIFSMLVTCDPGRARIIRTDLVTSATLRACERSPTSARTMARSVFPVGKDFCGIEHVVGRNDLQTDRGFGGFQPGGDDRRDLGRFAVERPHRDAQHRRPVVKAIGDEAGTEDDAGNARQQEHPGPDWQCD